MSDTRKCILTGPAKHIHRAKPRVLNYSHTFRVKNNAVCLSFTDDAGMRVDLMVSSLLLREWGDRAKRRMAADAMEAT